MPSHLHEGFVELFRHSPRLAADLLTQAVGVPVPAFDAARLESCDLPELAPTEYRADGVVVLTNASTALLGVVIEVQLRPDQRKRWSWPNYLTALRARLRCPTMLLVVCPDQATASWCAAPIDLGQPGFTLTPLVTGPEQIPVVTDVGQARTSPGLAVLSAIAHGAGAHADAVFRALFTALETVDADHATLYTDVVLASLPKPAREHLEDLMPIGTYEYQSDYARRYYGQGKAEGKAEGLVNAVLDVLMTRGIDVPDADRARITECTDVHQLETWHRRAITAQSVHDLFDRS